MESNHFDVVVVGAGLSGLIAAAFSARQKLRVALVATGPGSFALGSGCLKTRDIAKAGNMPPLNEAIGFFCETAKLAGSPLEGNLGRSRLLPTILGDFERVSLAPRLQWNVEPCTDVETAIVGIRGLSGFDENFMAERLNDQTHAMGVACNYIARQISFREDLGIPATTLRIAKRFDHDMEFRHDLMNALRNVARGFERILVPSMLGLLVSDLQVVEFERNLGSHLGELPTLPPSMPGLRMFERLWRYLRSIGVEQYQGFPVERLEIRDGLCTALEVASPGHALILHGTSVVLTSGRNATSLLAGKVAGVDAQRRPVGANGSPIAFNLFSTGNNREIGGGGSNDVQDIFAGYRAAQCAASAG